MPQQSIQNTIHKPQITSFCRFYYNPAIFELMTRKKDKGCIWWLKLYPDPYFTKAKRQYKTHLPTVLIRLSSYLNHLSILQADMYTKQRIKNKHQYENIDLHYNYRLTFKTYQINSAIFLLNKGISAQKMPDDKTAFVQMRKRQKQQTQTREYC